DLEKERNLDLEKTLAKETDKFEKFTKKFSLDKKSITKLKNSNAKLKESLSRSQSIHKALEVEHSTLLASTSKSNDATCSSTPSTSDSCSRCCDIDIDACATNSSSMQALKEENERLEKLMKYGASKVGKAKIPLTR